MNDMVFPNFPVMIKVSITGPTPILIRLWLDNDMDDLNVTYDIDDGKVYQSTRMSEVTNVDAQNISMTFNQTGKRWEVHFPITYKWNFPGMGLRDIGVMVEGAYGSVDQHVRVDAYRVEKNLCLVGEPKFTVDDPKWLNEKDFLRGGSNLKISQLSLHFEGAPQISPLPEDLLLGVEDDTGRFWPYDPVSRSELNTISFAIPVPKDDGPRNFSFKVIDTPPDSIVKGVIEFNFNIDSTPPSVADFRYRIKDGSALVSWSIKELGSGLDISSIQYRILGATPDEVDWTDPSGTVFDDERLELNIPLDDTEKDMNLMIRLSDKVGNSNSPDQAYYVTPNPIPTHDISLGEVVEFSPEPVIMNRLVHFKTTISNVGTSDEFDIPVEVTIEDTVIDRFNVDVLHAGTTREIRWDWVATEGLSWFKITADPMGRIDDEWTDNNVVSFLIDPEYLDVTAREDYIFASQENPEHMDLIKLSFSIRSIGSIESGPVKVRFYQDGKFMGLYQLPSIYKEGSRELVVDWKVDTTAVNLTLEIDPFDEIFESVEDNNRINFPNPFYEPPKEVEEVNEPGKEVPVTPITPAKEEPAQETNEEGGTTWAGPIDEPPKEGYIPTLDDEPLKTPSPDEPIRIPPALLPTIGVVLGTTFAGFFIFASRMEPWRYRWLGLLIPLYSKLKGNKIEKGIRHEILGYLKAKPGANYSELKHNLDLKDGSLVHHLRILEREEKIYSKKMGKYKLFYVTSYRRQAMIQDYISPFQLRILEIILENPGIVPKKLSRILDRSQTDMSYHLSELSHNGLLQRKKKGRNMHYYISEEYADIFS
ncbi:MAG: CARDB domain-containing protein [Thermoplasmatota archaeon]